jgi:hypothetical protein
MRTIGALHRYRSIEELSDAWYETIANEMSQLALGDPAFEKRFNELMLRHLIELNKDLLHDPKARNQLNADIQKSLLQLEKETELTRTLQASLFEMYSIPNA